MSNSHFQVRTWKLAM